MPDQPTSAASADGLVSVIIPVYNGQDYLADSLGTVRRQSYQPLEVIIIDDGSTDQSLRICWQQAEQDSRIKIIQQKNSGPAAARNAGLRQARGEFIFFADADDFLEDDAIGSLVKAYHQSRADLVSGDFRKISSFSSSSGHERFFPESRLLGKADIINYVKLYLDKPYQFILFVHCWGKLYRSAIIKGHGLLFDERLPNLEDVAFNFSYLRQAESVFFLKQIIYNYAIRDNYRSQGMKIGDDPACFNNYLRAFNGVSRFLLENNFSAAAAEKMIGHAYISYVIIILIRVGGRGGRDDREKLYRFFRLAASSPEIRQRLKFYSPSGGDSKIIPWLLKLKMIRPLIWACRRRYKKHRSNKK